MLNFLVVNVVLLTCKCKGFLCFSDGMVKVLRDNEWSFQEANMRPAGLWHVVVKLAVPQ